MNDEFERFVWKHIERKLATSGIVPSQGDLTHWVSIVRQALPGEKAPDWATPAPTSTTETQTLTRFALYFRRADMLVEVNANTGEPMSWSCAKFADGNTPLTPAEAMRVAQVATNLPPNAVLAQQGYEDIGGRPVFVAHWEHREDGVLVEHDYIRVLVSGHSGRVFSIQRRWHDVDLNGSER